MHSFCQFELVYDLNAIHADNSTPTSNLSVLSVLPDFDFEA